MVDKIEHIIEIIQNEPNVNIRQKNVTSLQREIIKLGGRKPAGSILKIDGIFGQNTEDAINAIDQIELVKLMQSILGVKFQLRYDISGNIVGDKDASKNNKSAKNSIMNYLGATEGTVIHQNQGEVAITSPFGIYKGAHPTADIFILLEKIAVSAGLDYEDPKDFDEINELIEHKYMDAVRNNAWSFYVKEFIDNKITSSLGPKSGLSVFSNSVNSGKHNGIVSLQYALGVTEDGIIGAMTLKAINAVSKDEKGDSDLNQAILEYMNSYYRRLVKNNPNRYYQFLTGWINRLKGLGYES